MLAVGNNSLHQKNPLLNRLFSICTYIYTKNSLSSPLNPAFQKFPCNLLLRDRHRRGPGVTAKSQPLSLAKPRQVKPVAPASHDGQAPAPPRPRRLQWGHFSYLGTSPKAVAKPHPLSYKAQKGNTIPRQAPR